MPSSQLPNTIAVHRLRLRAQALRKGIDSASDVVRCQTMREAQSFLTGSQIRKTLFLEAIAPARLFSLLETGSEEQTIAVCRCIQALCLWDGFLWMLENDDSLHDRPSALFSILDSQHTSIGVRVAAMCCLKALFAAPRQVRESLLKALKTVKLWWEMTRETIEQNRNNPTVLCALGDLITAIFSHPDDQWAPGFPMDGPRDFLGQLSAPQDTLEFLLAESHTSTTPMVQYSLFRAFVALLDRGSVYSGHALERTKLCKFVHLLLSHDEPSFCLLGLHCLSAFSRILEFPSDDSEIRELRWRGFFLLMAFLEHDMHDPDYQQVPLFFGNLVLSDRKLELQRAAAQGGAMNFFKRLLSQRDSLDARSIDYVVGGLLGLIERCPTTQAIAIRENFLPGLLGLAAHAAPSVRAKACLCLRVLCRSIDSQPQIFLETNVVRPLILCLSDPSPEVREFSLAAVCNVVLDFRNLRAEMLKQGVLALIIQCLDGPLSLRECALWSIKNLLYLAQPLLKREVIAKLTWDRLFGFLRDQHRTRYVQFQALGILRNLAYKDVSSICSGAGPELFVVLSELLQSSSASHLRSALYCVANLATGSEHKKALMNPLIIKQVLTSLDFDNSQVQAAALWCVVNLTWPTDAGSEERVQRLAEMGFAAKLRELLDLIPQNELGSFGGQLRACMQHFRSTNTLISEEPSPFLDASASSPRPEL